MIQLLIDILEGIFCAAAMDAQFAAVRCESAARYVVFDPATNLIWTGYADAGQVMHISRAMRLRIELIDHTLLLPPCAIRWSVQ